MNTNQVKVLSTTSAKPGANIQFVAHRVAPPLPGPPVTQCAAVSTTCVPLPPTSVPEHA